MSRFIRQKGYSLVEMMIVVVLMAFLMIGVVSLFMTLLRSNSETNALAKIKQEGDFATVALERVIRDGYDVDCVGDQYATIFSQNPVNHNRIDSRRISVDATTHQVKIQECLNYSTRITNCGTGGPTETGPNSTRVVTGSDQMEAELDDLQCIDRNGWDHDAVMIQFTLSEINADLEVPFRVITTLRNVEH